MNADLSLKPLKATLQAYVQHELAGEHPTAADFPKTIARLLTQGYRQSGAALLETQRNQVFKEIYDELVGYGPLQPLLDDPEITEIMVVGARPIYIEKLGEIFETEVRFDSDEHLLRIIERMIHPLGRRVDAESPTVDARLPDGSRINAVIPPVAVDGPLLTIRKFLENRMTTGDLIKLGALTPHMVEFLQACVAARLNILISGGTSSGKTTMLNALSSFIPIKERIITIEDAVELHLQQKHVVRMETRVANVDGQGEMDTRALVRNALRMRPDRIVVGEVRGPEAMDMLQAMNTGHSGSLTTLHANGPRDTISRLETMCMMAALDIPLLAIRRQIAAAINLIVHLTRLEDGARKVTQITEVAGMESDVVTLNDIFKFEKTGISTSGTIQGELKATGIRPLFTPRLEVIGYKLAGEVFGARQPGMWSSERGAGRR